MSVHYNTPTEIIIRSTMKQDLFLAIDIFSILSSHVISASAIDCITSYVADSLAQKTEGKNIINYCVTSKNLEDFALDVFLTFSIEEAIPNHLSFLESLTMFSVLFTTSQIISEVLGYRAEIYEFLTSADNTELTGDSLVPIGSEL